MRMKLSKWAAAFEPLARKSFRHPTADNIHDLRVLTRRIRTDLWLVPKSSRSKSIRRSRIELAHLADVLGKQRKYDVALVDAAQYHKDAKDLKSRLTKARREVRKSLRDRKIYSADVEMAVRDMKRMRPAVFVPRIVTLQRSLSAAAEHLPRSNEARHRLRIQFKKARYVLDAFGHKDRILKELQEHLGRWHDLITLASLTSTDRILKAAQRREWTLAENLIRPESRRAVKALSNVIRRLGSSHG